MQVEGPAASSALASQHQSAGAHSGGPSDVSRSSERCGDREYAIVMDAAEANIMTKGNRFCPSKSWDPGFKGFRVGA